MQKLSKKGFTLMEIILVIAVLGILISALFPSFSAYQRRGRDTARISHITSLAKVINNYFLDKEGYPGHVAGCVNSTALSVYGNIPSDPLIANDNGCGANGNYAYGSSSLLLSSPNEFTLIAKLEGLNAGNYNTGSVTGLTGALTQVAFTHLTSNMQKGAGQYYIRTR